MRIFAISGSLRARSFNTALLLAAGGLVPPDVAVELYEGLGGLPHFNPDLDIEPPPAAVADLRARLAEADGVLICSPEYAHGVPGSLKNALDWIVSSGEFTDKPVLLINASPSFMGASLAQANLVEILRVMGASLPDSAVISIASVSRKVGPDGTLVAETQASLKNALTAFVASI
ncbi:MAG: NAD(P)H-dependent oxidoreductase [Acidobacteria bacterium]|nr:NAD(P)H-dependent oxidoreductase [Acidobacteriota bacterium]